MAFEPSSSENPLELTEAMFPLRCRNPTPQAERGLIGGWHKNTAPADRGKCCAFSKSSVAVLRSSSVLGLPPTYHRGDFQAHFPPDYRGECCGILKFHFAMTVFHALSRERGSTRARAIPGSFEFSSLSFR